MPKVGMEPIRRKQLIDATLFSIEHYGLEDTTIARIAKKAGVSSGIISHYFGGKDGLIEATMREVLTELQTAVAHRRKSVSPEDTEGNIRAIIEGNFDRSQLSETAIKTWLAFWVSSMHHPQLKRLQAVNDRRLYSNLSYQFSRRLPLVQARDAARGLAALIDGLWLRGALMPERFDIDAAVRIATSYAWDQLTPRQH
ncbi:HTH-type transcriptional regulator BetI [Halomonadaceae bacterium LMG 33818]|uniref:transcriptional regulator BetI n=1 Tax=Cernens ardua TaxID=3402176 RepID=UPI003EDBBC77